MTKRHVIFFFYFLLLSIASVRCETNKRDKRRSEMLVLSPPGKSQKIRKELYLKQIKEAPTNIIKRDTKNVENEEEDVEEEYNDNSNVDYSAFLGGSLHKRDKKHHASTTRSGPKVWDHWGKWSTCSASCGMGKITRWRHCVSGSCAQGEKEAQIKTCTLPAC